MTKMIRLQGPLHRLIRHVSIVCLASSIAATACGTPTDPVVIIQPRIAELEIDTIMLGSHRFVRINAVPSDTNLKVEKHHRVPITANSSVDSERLLLRPELCFNRNGDPYRCDEFIMVFEDRVDAGALAERVSRLPGRLVSPTLQDRSGEVIFESGDFATVVMFDGPLERAMHEAAGWPGVRSVEFVMVGHTAVVGSPAIDDNRLTVAVPVELDAPFVRSDGVLQVERGGTISATYQQEAEAAVQASIVIAGG